MHIDKIINSCFHKIMDAWRFREVPVPGIDVNTRQLFPVQIATKQKQNNNSEKYEKTFFKSFRTLEVSLSRLKSKFIGIKIVNISKILTWYY